MAQKKRKSSSTSKSASKTSRKSVRTTGRKSTSKQTKTSATRKKKVSSPTAIEPEVLGPEDSAPQSASAGPSAKSTIDTELSDEEVALGVLVDDNQEEPDSSQKWLKLYQNQDLPALSPTDPLQQYMKEISRYALLDLEEELALARRMREKGDLQAARLLVQANLRLVVKIAFEYRSIYNNIMDLIQEGNVGLMKAVSKYDPSHGARLGYYSSWWIKSYILKYILDNFRLVKIGTTQAQKKLFYHLMREKQRLEAQGIQAGPKLLADKLNVKESEVQEMSLRLSHSGSEASIDTPLGGQSEGESRQSYKDLLPADLEAADDRLAHQQTLEILQDHLPAFRQTLNDRERLLLEKRVLAEDPQTLQEIADRYGLTRERVRQIESGLIGKLRNYLKENLNLSG